MIWSNTIVQCALIVGFSFIIPQSSVFADQNPKKGSCVQDANKYCPSLKWGKGLGRCLVEHKTELSETCANKLTEVKSAAKEFQTACAGDVKEFCSNIQPGSGRVMECLRANETHLSAVCKTRIHSFGLRHGDALNQNFGVS